MFGDCCIPGLMLLLGATLAAGPGAAGVPARLIVGVTAVRLLLLPAAGTAWIMAAKAIGERRHSSLPVPTSHVPLPHQVVGVATMPCYQ
jgi:predicted permease